MDLECKNFNKMIEILRKKRIICWGIGNYFDSFIDSIDKYIDEINIVYLIDNNLQFKDKKKTINGKEIEIISFDNYLKIKQKQDIIVITTVHYNSIIEQIKSVSDIIDYIPYALVKHNNLNNRICIKRSEEKLIPSIIHYCWFGKGEMPQKEKEYVEGWKRKCPDYKIICWNENNFDVEKNVFLKWAYKNRKWAFVSDYVRMYVLYEYGGIYLDTDVELIKNLDELTYQYAYMGMEESGCAASGLGMGTVAKNPIIKEIIDEYESIDDREIKSWKFYEVNAKRESDVLRKYGFKANNQYQIIEDIAIFPSEFFSPVQVGKKEMNITENTFSIHHYHYSWLDETEKNKIWQG